MTTAVKKSAKKVTKAAKGKGKNAKPEAAATETTLADRERKHYQEIQELGAECEKLEADFKDKKATASAAKSAWESAVSVLQATIRRGPSPQLPLPFREAPEYLQTDILEAFPDLTARQVGLLEDSGILTVGELEDLRAGAGLRSIKGIGEAKADQLEDMLLDFISRKQREAAAATDADVDDQDDEDGDS
jgi:hypothetical protein